MPEPTPPEGVAMCEKWEGWHRALPDGRAKPYLCPAKVPTIGFGSTYWDDGRKVKLTDEAITKEVGRQLLLRQLQNYANAVDRSIKVPIHPQMRAACISLAYNIGTGAFAKSTLVRRINAKDWANCPEAFKRYKIGGGRVLTGLLNRRIDESALFMRGVAEMKKAPVTSSVPQPPVAAPQKATTASAGSWWDRLAGAILDGLRAPHPA
jgi:lysozyme